MELADGQDEGQLKVSFNRLSSVVEISYFYNRKSKNRLLGKQKESGIMSPLLDPLLGGELELSESSDTELDAKESPRRSRSSDSDRPKSSKSRSRSNSSEGHSPRDRKGKSHSYHRPRSDRRSDVIEVEREEDQSERYSVGGDVDVEQGSIGWQRPSSINEASGSMHDDRESPDMMSDYGSSDGERLLPYPKPDGN